MQITVSSYAGFCEGVDRAYNIVKKVAGNSKVKRPIFVLGSLVHNQEVIEKIKNLGVKKLNFPNNPQELIKVLDNRIGTLIITAHGVGPLVYEIAKKKGINIVNTTCPKVIKVQKLANLFIRKMNQVILIGDKDHKEVKGIHEWSQKKAILVEDKDDLEKLSLDKEKKIVIVSQTTQNKNFVKEAYEYLKNKYQKVDYIDTLCNATKNRQNEVKKLAKENDAIIIIGSKESANSTRLWEIANKMNNKAYFVEKINDIRKDWFLGCEKIGVSSGASTPQWIIEDIIRFLKRI